MATKVSIMNPGPNDVMVVVAPKDGFGEFYPLPVKELGTKVTSGTWKDFYVWKDQGLIIHEGEI